MKTFMKLLKNELDVDILSALHMVVYITMYGFYTWLDHNDGVPFAYIVQMFVIGYICTWLQQILYLRKVVHKKFAYQLYIVLWNVIPLATVFVCQNIFGWFHTSSTWVAIAFDITILVYFPIICWILEVFYRRDSEELNHLLEGYKKKYSK